MQTKITEILSEAKGWMTAAEIAEKGGWRSGANVAVALQQMEKSDSRVERQKSATKKQSNGMPATEWKLAEKTFGEKAGDQKSVKYETQRQPASTGKTQEPVFAQPTHDDGWLEAARIRECLALAEKQRDEFKDEAEQANRENDSLMNLAAEYECKSIPDLRVLIGSLESRVVTLQMSVGSLREKLDNRESSFPTDAATQFVVRTPSKPPRFTKKHASAHATAMSAARQHGFAEVFALVPVGKAMRGAVWSPK